MSEFDFWQRTSWSPEEQSSIEQQDGFWGWHVEGQTTSVLLCPNGAFHVSRRFGACCAEDSCPMKTECVGSTVYQNNNEQYECAEGYSCVTMSIYQTGRPESTVRDIFCKAGDWPPLEVQRQLPAETTSSDSSTSSSESSPTPSDTSTTASSTSSETPASSSPSEGPGSDDGGSDLTWIAGAVIGPVALIVALVLGIWWYRRRSAAKAAAGDPGRHEMPGMSQGQYPHHHQYPQQQWTPVSQQWSSPSGHTGHTQPYPSPKPYSPPPAHELHTESR